MDNRDFISYIDDISCNSFNAKLLHREINPVEVVNHNDWLENALQPIKIKDSTFSYSEITLVYFVEGENEKDTLKNISKLIKAHTEAIVRFSDLNNLKFKTILSDSKSKQIKDEFYELTIILKSEFKLDAEKSITINKDTVINCSSDVQTPAILIIKAIADVPYLQVKVNDDEYLFTAINEGDEIVINGEDYTVLLNGESNLEVVDLWAFPVLNCGDNNIVVSNKDVDVTVKYVERLI